MYHVFELSVPPRPRNFGPHAKVSDLLQRPEVTKTEDSASRKGLDDFHQRLRDVVCPGNLATDIPSRCLSLWEISYGNFLHRPHQLRRLRPPESLNALLAPAASPAVHGANPPGTCVPFLRFSLNRPTLAVSNESSVGGSRIRAFIPCSLGSTSTSMTIDPFSAVD